MLKCPADLASQILRIARAEEKASTAMRNELWQRAYILSNDRKSTSEGLDNSQWRVFVASRGKNQYRRVLHKRHHLLARPCTEPRYPFGPSRVIECAIPHHS